MAACLSLPESLVYAGEHPNLIIGIHQPVHSYCISVFPTLYQADGQRRNPRHPVFHDGLGSSKSTDTQGQSG